MKNQYMISFRKNAIIAGILFLTALVSSLLGGGLLESVLKTPDHLTIIPTDTSVMITGVILEFVNGIAVIGIAVILFPVLKQYNESIALGYVGFRIIESIFCIVSAMIPVALIKLSREYKNAGTSYMHTLSTFIIEARTELAELLIPVFFGLGALLFYYLLYKSKLIPRLISVWGFIGAILILILCFIEGNTIINMIFVLPIILNEIFLGIWLIVKGFDKSRIISGTEQMS
jgi:hypothetical protein